MNCSLCNKEDITKHINITKPDRFERFLKIKKPNRTWVVCNFCNTAKNFQKKKNLIKLNKISKNYYDIDIGKDNLIKKFQRVVSLKDSDNKGRCNRIRKFLNDQKLLKKKINLLDIGTGLGVFPYEIKKDFLRNKIQKIDVVETDPLAIKHLKKVLNKDVVDLKKCKKDYDLITLNKVLEHIIDPIKFLRFIDKKIMKEGSIIYIEVPCVSNLTHKKKTDNSLGFLHHNLYSKKSLFLIAKLFDYEVLGHERINESSGKITQYVFLKKKETKSNYVNFISNVYIQKDKNLTKVYYKSKFGKKKEGKKIKKYEDSLHLNIGYRKNKNQGEYTSIKINRNIISIDTDMVGSYQLYYLKKKNSLFISTDLDYLVKKNNEIKLNETALCNLYLFGYCNHNFHTIYKDIYKINSGYRYDFNSKGLVRVLKNPNPKRNFPINKNDLLDLNIHDILKFFGSKIKNSFLPLTSGIDSNILLRKLIKQKVNFDTGIISMVNKSKEQIIASQNSIKFNNNLKIFKFSKNPKRINKLLNEYSMITAGMGVSSEIFLLDFHKIISKKYKIIFTGFGGELSRNFFKNKKYFIDNYITNKKTLKKFLVFKYQKKISNALSSFKKKSFDSKNFYLKDRYPNNISRKNKVLMTRLFPINFLTSQDLFDDKEKIKDDNFMKIFEITNYIKPKSNRLDDAFDINKFFKLIEKRLIKEIDMNKKLFKIGLLKTDTINFINKKKLNISDKWFLLRILNLLIFLNKNSKLLI